MAQLAQSGHTLAEAGNTKNRLRSRGWFMTINNFSMDDEANIKNIGAEKWIYQEEVGNSGTAHLQVFLYFKNPLDFQTIKRWFPGAHIEQAKSNKESINYCSKPETRVRGPFVHNLELEKKINIISEFKPWQQEILDLIQTEPDHRSIYWIYDHIGNTGKTSLCKYICVTNPKAIYLGGAAKDMKYAISKASIKPSIILIDMSRSQEGHISYQGIEEIKNGIFFTTKYESQMTILNCPHVICFANFRPNTSSLSTDRWRIIDLNNSPSPAIEDTHLSQNNDEFGI